MIPNIQALQTELTEVSIPSTTYKIQMDLNRLSGSVTDLAAVAQSVYLMLGTERYESVLYSWNYGVELLDLFGKPMPYVQSELERRITEALLTDDRIESVSDFHFAVNKRKLHVTFTVKSVFGQFETETEVAV